MPETMIVALISVVGTLAATIVVQIVTVYIFTFRNKLDIKQKEYQNKRDNLTVVYKTLLSVLNSFPNRSPNDILEYLEYGPYYSYEAFDAVLKSLDYQIEDYKDKLKISNLDYDQRSNIETQISNREYSKKKISEIRDEYFDAKEKYQLFCKSDKMIFDLYAGQDVKNCLVEFEVVIHNVFISGRSAGDADDPINNNITVLRRNLVNYMRKDIGT